MFKLPIRTWVRNAAAVFSAQHGAVAQQAREAGCSRETVYVHARKVEQHLDAALNNDAAWAELHAENLRLQHEVNALRRDAELRVRFDKPRQLEFATTAFAMGVSLRRIEDLMESLLAESDRNAPRSFDNRPLDRRAGPTRHRGVPFCTDRRGSAAVPRTAVSQPAVLELSESEIHARHQHLHVSDETSAA